MDFALAGAGRLAWLQCGGEVEASNEHRNQDPVMSTWNGMHWRVERHTAKGFANHHDFNPCGLSLDELSIDTLRLLAVDAVQKANSGHPGAPLGCAPIAYLLFHKLMKHNPANSQMGRPRPLCALQRPRLGAALFHAVSLRLQRHARRSEELPPVALADAGPSRVRRHRRRGSDHRPAGSGHRHGRGHGHCGEAPGRRLQPARLRGGRITTPMRCWATAT